MFDIKPINKAGSHRTGDLSGFTKKEITKILGFEPNIQDDPYKVTASWGFTVDGVACGIWDYKGSAVYKEWSTYDPANVLDKIFYPTENT